MSDDTPWYWLMSKSGLESSLRWLEQKAAKELP